MSLSSPRAAAHARRHRGRRGTVLAAAAVALGAAGVGALAPTASAADQYGPGYRIPDDHGHPTSHLGAFGKPSPYFPNAVAHAYCADPTLAGPKAGGHYSKIGTARSWTSKATGKKVSDRDFDQASYILAKYGETQNDAQAAAVDAATTSLLNTGSTYALPHGKRAQERLDYATVPDRVRSQAKGYLAEAARYAGPYTLHLHRTSQKPLPGTGTKLTAAVDVISASGHTVPGARIHVRATGAAQAEGTVTADGKGQATITLTPSTTGTVHLAAHATNLPAGEVRAQLPSRKQAQRMVIPTNHTARVEAHRSITVHRPGSSASGHHLAAHHRPAHRPVTISVLPQTGA